MISWRERAKLLQTESQRFQHYLSELPDDAWSKQSACDLWRANDVVAHLVSNAEFYAATVEQGLKGDGCTRRGHRAPAGVRTTDMGQVRREWPAR